MDDWLTAKEAALALGISYPAFIARMNRGKIKTIKKGWSILVHKDEIARLMNNGGDNEALAREDMV